MSDKPTIRPILRVLLWELLLLSLSLSGVSVGVECAELSALEGSSIVIRSE